MPSSHGSAAHRPGWGPGRRDLGRWRPACQSTTSCALRCPPPPERHSPVPAARSAARRRSTGTTPSRRGGAPRMGGTAGLRRRRPLLRGVAGLRQLSGRRCQGLHRGHCGLGLPVSRVAAPRRGECPTRDARQGADMSALSPALPWTPVLGPAPCPTGRLAGHVAGRVRACPGGRYPGFRPGGQYGWDVQRPLPVVTAP